MNTKRRRNHGTIFDLSADDQEAARRFFRRCSETFGPCTVTIKQKRSNSNAGQTVHQESNQRRARG
jgi:hypothetical protein